MSAKPSFSSVQSQFQFNSNLTAVSSPLLLRLLSRLRGSALPPIHPSIRPSIRASVRTALVGSKVSGRLTKRQPARPARSLRFSRCLTTIDACCLADPVCRVRMLRVLSSYE